MREKLLHNRNGLVRAAAILIVILAVLIILCLIPVWKKFKYQADQIGCVSALDTAYRELAVDYLDRGGDQSLDDAVDRVTYAMDGWNDLCPANGTVYITQSEDNSGLPYELVCGLHDLDIPRRTRLNASYCKKQIIEQVRQAQLRGTQYPETVTIGLNGKTLTAKIIDEDSDLRRGTATIKEEKGTVVYYSIVGHSDFGADSGEADGTVWYVSFADENYCANWKSNDGWTGDSYEQAE